MAKHRLILDERIDENERSLEAPSCPSLVVLVLALTMLVTGSATRAQTPWAAERDNMINTIQRHLRGGELDNLPNRISAEVTEAMRTVPRHEFVPSSLLVNAYEDRPLPIGYGQTISQPFIVALMSELLQVEPGDTVLEVGTGSGYQAAVLAEMGVNVLTIEIVPELAAMANARLNGLGYSVEVRNADGYYGWQEHAPFDGIVVTAATPNIPPPLIEQLKPGARMVIPVGPRFRVQQLVLVTRSDSGRVRSRQLLPVTFVPLTRNER